MRIALLQLALDRKSSAANMQIITAAIERTAKANPAPDLLIFPGACDTGGGKAGSHLTEARLQGIAETIAWKAREWGVFIAAGLHVCEDERVVPCAAVFDEDGDIVMRSGSATDAAATNTPVEFWHTAVGDIGVVGHPSDIPETLVASAGKGGGLIAWPVVATTAKERQACDTAAAALCGSVPTTRGAYWGVVSAAHSWPHDRHPGTFVCSPEGRVLSFADSQEETILYAEAPLTTTLPRGPVDDGSHGDHAD